MSTGGPEWRRRPKENPRMPTAVPPSPPFASPVRQIRVFVSSTFRDMQEERDLLIKHVFPQLRRLCDERAVTWTEVDLRWGITTEQVAEGQVLPVCLEEIRRCRPYFIGLLGERYGSVPAPGSTPLTLLEAQPWLREHPDASITSLEILYGALSEQAARSHAYFYFRDARYIEDVPQERRADFVHESTAASERLDRLKAAIRAASARRQCSLREGYANPAQLAEWVLEDFSALIEQLFPRGQTPDPLDQEAARHAAYGQNRRQALVGRDDLLQALDDQVYRGTLPLVVTGEAGSGKSALLAEWAARWASRNPEDLVVRHHVGSTPESADWRAIVRRVLGEVKRRFTIADDLPTREEDLRGALHGWTNKAIGRHRVVLVLDGLNQLADLPGARQLAWLPTTFPDPIRVLVSTQPGECLDTLRVRAWGEMAVPPLRVQDIAPAARAYFALFSKTPPDELLAELESASAVRNPLYLRTVLDELRQFGIHERLVARARDYLSAPGLSDLFDRVLARWQADFGRDAGHGDVVRRALSLIACARYGLSEIELLEILGVPDDFVEGQATFVDFTSFVELGSGEWLRAFAPLPRARWSPFFLAAEQALSISAGVLTLGHEHLLAAIQRRFLKTPGYERHTRQAIARYFWMADVGRRSAAELPWQFVQMREWSDLILALVSPNLLLRACQDDRQCEWMGYWQEVRRLAAEDDVARQLSLTTDIPGLYRQAVARMSDDQKATVLAPLGQLLLDLGYATDAQQHFAAEALLLSANDVIASPPEGACLLASNLNDQGRVMLDAGDARGAIEFLKRAEGVLEAHPQHPEVRRARATVLLNQGRALRDLHDGVRSAAVLETTLQLMQEAYGDQSVEAATAMQALGSTLLSTDPPAALTWHRRAFAIRRDRLGEQHRDTALSVGNIGGVLLRMGHFHDGERLSAKASGLLTAVVGGEHEYTRNLAKTLADCRQLAECALSTPSGAGLVLLAFDYPASDARSPTPDPGAIAGAIVDALVDTWDEMLSHGRSIPTAILCCPGHEAAVDLALSDPVAARFAGGLLRTIRIPRLPLNPDIRDQAALLDALQPIVSVRDEVVRWVADGGLAIVMARPVANSDAGCELQTLEFVRREYGPSLSSSRPASENDSSGGTTFDRPLVLEVVPFDGELGPLTGLFTGGPTPRPAVIPTAAWKAQGYRPQARDTRATGTVYLNVDGLSASAEGSAGGEVGPLDAWSMEPLLAMATAEPGRQPDVFEQALADLLMTLQSGQLSCPPERGSRRPRLAELPTVGGVALHRVV
jgi:hypothetical protein